MLVLGILSLVLCGLLAPFAWVKGSRVLRQIDARPGTYGNRGSVQAGRIMGIVVTCTTTIGLVLGGVFLVLALQVSDEAVETSSLNACRNDTKTLQTAVAVWNATYVRGGSPLPTPWPRSEADLVYASLLEYESSLHTLEGDGTAPPIVAKVPGRCEGEEIVQMD